MRTKFVRTIFVGLLVLASPGCEEEEPVPAPQSDQEDVSSTEDEAASAKNRQVAQAPSHPLTPDDPQWLTALSPKECEDLQRADDMMRDAYGLWSADRLDRAKATMEAAKTIFVRLPPQEQHWKFWDCDRELSRLEAEQDEKGKKLLEKAGLRHAIDIDNRLNQLVTEGDPHADKVLDRICDFLKRAHADDAPFLAEFMRQLYLGKIASNRDDRDAAARHFLDAEKRMVDVFPLNHPTTVLTRVWMSDNWVHGGERDDLEKAADRLDEAIKSLEESTPLEGDYAPLWPLTLQVKARVAEVTGRITDAKTFHELAIRLSERASSESRRSYFVQECAEFHNRIGDYGSAKELLESIDDPPPELRDSWLMERGLALGGLAQYDEAFASCRKALDGACRKRPTARQKFDCLRARYYYGAVLKKACEFDKALSQFDLAEPLAEKRLHQKHIEIARAGAKIGKAAVSRDSDLLRSVRKGLTALSLPDDSDYHVVDSRRYRLLARVDLLLGDLDKADRQCEKAIVRYRRALKERRFHPVGLAMWHEIQSPYLLSAVIKARRGKNTAAFDRMERHAAQGLSKVLGQDETTDVVSLDEFLAGPVLDDKTAVVGWLDDIPEAGIPPIDRRWAFVLRKSGATWVPIDDGGDDGEQAAKLIRSLAGKTDPPTPRSDEWMEYAHQLYKHRLEPVMSELNGIERLYVLNRGVMAGIPVEVLLLEKSEQGQRPKLAGNRFCVAYAPSCSTLAKLHDRVPRRSRGEPSLLAVGNPPPSPSSQRLPAASSEIEWVSSYFSNPEVLEGAEADETVIYLRNDTDQGLRGYDYIHIVAHAHADLYNPYNCELILAQPAASSRLTWSRTHPDRFYDGRLGFREIRTLILDACLVVLSACETALGRPLQSEGYLGLPHAFFEAGARALAVTLWKVEDVSSAILVERFYYYLREQQKDPAEALQLAKQELRELSCGDVRQWCRDHKADDLAEKLAVYPSDEKLYEHPRYWAAMILVGPQD